MIMTKMGELYFFKDEWGSREMGKLQYIKN
jgi:hypothetical protein